MTSLIPPTSGSIGPEDKKKKTFLEEGQKEKIEKAVLTDTVENLDKDQTAKVIEALKDPKKSFLDGFDDIKKIIGRRKVREMEKNGGDEMKTLNETIAKIIAEAIKAKKTKIEAKIDALDAENDAPGTTDDKKAENDKKIEALEDLLGILEKSEVKDRLKEPEAPKNENEIAEVKDIKTVDDIKKNEAVCRRLVTRYGQKPKPGIDKDLRWEDKSKPSSEWKTVSPEDVKKYEDFMAFMKVEKTILDEIQSDAVAIAAKLEKELGKNPNQEIMSVRLREETTELLDGLLSKSKAFAALTERGATKEGAEAIFLYTLKVQELPRAFEKLQNVIQLEMVPSIRKGKEIFQEEIDEKTGKRKTQKLSEFLSDPDRQGYGEVMVEQTHEVLLKVYNQIGKDKGFDLATTRDFLIQVIKTRGGKAVKIGENTLTDDEAKKMYTAFLVMKDEHLGEKEALQLLIALKERPPFVYELRNTGNGWEITGPKKEGSSVLEDFCLDGMIYNELKDKLGMNGGEFDTFIQKVAPNFELMRSAIIKGKEITLKDKDGKDLFSPAEIDQFKKLMHIPLWVDKVGQAFKHSLYKKNQDGEVPVIKKIQGADVKKLDVMFVNIEEKLGRIAERLADERLDQELKEAGPQGWKQLWRLDKIACKFWMRNAAVAYREKYIEEFKLRLKQDPKYRTELMQLDRPEVKPTGKWSGDAPAEGQRQDLNGELDAIAERFGVSFASGDNESFLTDNESIEAIENKKIQEDIKKLCIDYKDSKIDDAGFRQQMKGIIQQIKTLKGTTDEIVGFLEETTDKGSVSEHKEGLLDKLRAHKAGLIALDLDNMRVNLGTAKNVDVKSQVKDLNWSDGMSRKIVEGLQKNKFLGRFITPATIGIIGFGLANITAQIATSRTLRWSALALAPFTGPAMWGIAAGCLTGGAFAALRKNKETLYHKAQKERRDAMHYDPDDDRKGLRPGQAHSGRFERRMESTLYQKVEASDLTSTITTAAAGSDYTTLCNALGRAVAYNTISEKERVDLIKYKDENNIESERLALVRAISTGRARLRALAAGRDHIADLAQARGATESQIRKEMADAESKFKSFKRGENFKAAGIGALFGGGTAAALTGIGHLAGWSNQSVSSTSTSTNNLTSGNVNHAALDSALKGAGVSQTEINGLTFNPNGTPTAATLAFLQTKHINLTSVIGPPTSITTPITNPLAGGAQMSQAQFITEANAKGAGLVSSDFDAAGHLAASGTAKLAAHNINFVEHVTRTGGGSVLPPVPALNTAGFSRISALHFNGHTPKHILDELRLKWAGVPEVGADGNCHFSMKGMVDGSLAHTKMPGGISLPSDPSKFKIGLEVRQGGHSYWKFFTPDSRGDVAIPKEFFTNNPGYVARGGSLLPGLRTHGMAVGFDDSHGTYQVMASVRGGGGYIPEPVPGHEVVDFTGTQSTTTDVVTPGEAAYAATQDVENTILTDEFVASPPIVASPMSHLEYGKKKPPVVVQPQPPVVIQPPVVPGSPDEPPVVPGSPDEPPVVPGSPDEPPVVPGSPDEPPVVPGSPDEPPVVPGSPDEPPVVPGSPDTLPRPPETSPALPPVVTPTEPPVTPPEAPSSPTPPEVTPPIEEVKPPEVGPSSPDEISAAETARLLANIDAPKKAQITKFLKENKLPVSDRNIVLVNSHLSKPNSIPKDEVGKWQYLNYSVNFLNAADLARITENNAELDEIKNKIPATLKRKLSNKMLNVVANFYKQNEVFFGTQTNAQAFKAINDLLVTAASVRGIDLATL